MKTIDVCLTPDLVHLYDLKGKVVVIVDILRATSCMTVGIANGVKSIWPFASLEACRAARKNGYFIAGERDGKKVEGFDLGNSPFDYMQERLKGEKIAATTTNGTLAIERSKDAQQIVIGSFLNKSAIAKYLRSQSSNILILCAGWKGRINLEDTIFAGALVEALKSDARPSCDSSKAAQVLYRATKQDLFSFLRNSSHAQRLKMLDIEKDISFCLQEDTIDIIPVISEGEIIKMSLSFS